MEEIKDHRHIKTREWLFNTEKLPANIPSVPHVQTIRTFDSEQNSAYHWEHLIKVHDGFDLESRVQINCWI